MYSTVILKFSIDLPAQATVNFRGWLSRSRGEVGTGAEGERRGGDWGGRSSSFSQEFGWTGMVTVPVLPGPSSRPLHAKHGGGARRAPRGLSFSSTPGVSSCPARQTHVKRAISQVSHARTHTQKHVRLRRRQGRRIRRCRTTTYAAAAVWRSTPAGPGHVHGGCQAGVPRV